MLVTEVIKVLEAENLYAVTQSNMIRVRCVIIKFQWNDDKFYLMLKVSGFKSGFGKNEYNFIQ